MTEYQWIHWRIEPHPNSIKVALENPHTITQIQTPYSKPFLQVHVEDAIVKNHYCKNQIPKSAFI